MQPTPVFLAWGFHRQKSLAGYSPQGHTESGMAEHTATGRSENKQQVPLLTAGGGRAGSFQGEGMFPQVAQEGWLRWFAHPLCGVCRGHVQSPAFPPGCLEMAVGVSWSLCIFCPAFALPCACIQLFLILYSLFLFCFLRRCLSRFRHFSTAAKGPRFQPVSMVGLFSQKTCAFFALRSYY